MSAYFDVRPGSLSADEN